MAVRILIGTVKGAFILDDPGGAAQLSGPFCDGWPVNHVIGDPATGTIWAAAGNDFFGAGVWRCDGGAWSLSLLANGELDAILAGDPDFAAMVGAAPNPPAPFSGQVAALWVLGRSNGTLYAGAKPAALLSSGDGGATWDMVTGLSDHPSRGDWQPGGAGLVLHSIAADPGDAAKLWVAISAAGVFATEDGGATWDRRNRLSNAETPAAHGHAAAPCGHDTGICVHNIVRAPGAGDLMYQQNHHGTYRSRDGGRSWDDVTAGLPSTFGFPIAVSPRDPDTVFTFPLNGDVEGRFPPDAAAAVWRSRDGGATWQAMRDGLPQRAYFTVLRQGMATDPDGAVYFGTNTGSLFGSFDDGETWAELARHLPAVLAVETLSPARGGTGTAAARS